MLTSWRTWRISLDSRHGSLTPGASQCGPAFAALTAATIGGYTWYTFALTSWRTKIRREMNRFDNEASARSVDSLVNYETVKYFGNERHELNRRVGHAGQRDAYLL